MRRKEGGPERAVFWSRGLRFSCARCSDCCRLDPGFVYLSKKDVSRLAKSLGMGYTVFIEVYCRWAPGERGRERLSLKEKANFDCVFWKEGCTVYEARPLQCRAFPFWPSALSSAGAWECLARECPGMGKGWLIPPDRIADWLAEQEQEAVISRRLKGGSGAD